MFFTYALILTSFSQYPLSLTTYTRIVLCSLVVKILLFFIWINTDCISHVKSYLSYSFWIYNLLSVLLHFIVCMYVHCTMYIIICFIFKNCIRFPTTSSPISNWFDFWTKAGYTKRAQVTELVLFYFISTISRLYFFINYNKVHCAICYWQCGLLGPVIFYCFNRIWCIFVQVILL